MNEKTMYTVGELAVVLGVSESAAWYRTKAPGFPTVRCGRRILIPIKAFEAWRRDLATRKAVRA